MFHLIYVSSATKEMNDDDLLELLKQARDRNERQNVTGMLLYGKQNFLQIIEGEEKDIDEIYDAIVNDARNTGNIIIQRKEISERSFPDWRMGFKYLSNQEIAVTKGYTDFVQNESSLDYVAEKSAGIVSLLMGFKDSIE